MTPISNPKDYDRPEQPEFQQLPDGYSTMIIDDAVYETQMKDGSPTQRIKVAWKPLLLVGNYGLVFQYLSIEKPHILLVLCDVIGLSQNHSFDPGVRMDAHPENPNAWDEHKIAANLPGRVCECLMKPDTYEGRKKSAIDIFNDKEPVFKQYFEGGEPYVQPPLVGVGEPPQQAQPEQQSLAPPSDDETIHIDDNGNPIQ